MNNYKMTELEYKSINIVKSSQNPLAIYSLHTWDQAYMFNLQFMINWRAVLNLPDASPSDSFRPIPRGTWVRHDLVLHGDREL